MFNARPLINDGSKMIVRVLECGFTMQSFKNLNSFLGGVTLISIQDKQAIRENHAYGLQHFYVPIQIIAHLKLQRPESLSAILCSQFSSFSWGNNWNLEMIIAKIKGLDFMFTFVKIGSIILHFLSSIVMRMYCQTHWHMPRKRGLMK